MSQPAAIALTDSALPRRMVKRQWLVGEGRDVLLIVGGGSLWSVMVDMRPTASETRDSLDTDFERVPPTCGNARRFQRQCETTRRMQFR